MAIRPTQIALPLLACAGLLLSGCTDKAVSFESPGGKPKPYVLKEACKYSIIEEHSQTSIISPMIKKGNVASTPETISLGGKSITVSNCQIIANSNSLPVYEEKLQLVN